MPRIRNALSVASSIGGQEAFSRDDIIQFAKKARTYKSNIEITVGGMTRDAKDSEAAYELKIAGGTTVTITAIGEDCTKAANGMIKFLKNLHK